MLFLTLALGLVLLVAGGESLVRGAVALSTRLGVSPLVIGLTVVGFGTSTPELVTSLQAALADAPGIALGNVIGSNIANIGLILGLAALIRPQQVEARAFRRDGTALVAATLACVAVVSWGMLTRPMGAVLLTGLAAYLLIAFRQDRQATQPEIDAPALSPLAASLFAAGGIALTILGARLLVTAATQLAEHAGLSETFIGLTVVAVGTSLPELAAALAAAIRRQSGLVLGNVIGSNIFNVLGILGVTALVKPIPVPDDLALPDLAALTIATAALAMAAMTGLRITRTEGALLMAGYAGYIGLIASGAP
jgi:cation:H+ antiporter